MKESLPGREFGDILEELVFKRATDLIGPMVDYKEAVESGDKIRMHRTESRLRDILPSFDQEQLRVLLRIK